MDAGDIDALRTRRPARSTRRAAPQPHASWPPATRAPVGPDGLAIAPASAPDAVKAIIAAGNQIASKPYVYGGGHGKLERQRL